MRKADERTDKIMKRILAIFLAALLSVALLTSCTNIIIGGGTITIEEESTTIEEESTTIEEESTMIEGQSTAPDEESTTPDDNSEGNWTKNY